MESGRQNIVFQSVLFYQIPFCRPFWESIGNFTNENNKQPTLWERLPDECKTSSKIVLGIACLVVITCIFIHLGTIVAYTSLKNEILERERKYNEERRNMRRREKVRKKTEPSIIKEAADFAFAMKTQNRLRRTLAFIGLLTGALQLPLILASTSAVYFHPFSLNYLAEFRTSMKTYGTAISALFHLTLTATLCTFLLMTVERIRETMRMCPNAYFKSSLAEVGKAKFFSDNGDYERSSNFPQGSIRSRNRLSWKFNREVRNETVLPEATLLYTFRESYSFIDLVTVLFVPATSGIVTTIALAVFESRFEAFGISSTSPGAEKLEYIPGILSYNVAYYPNCVYFYVGTIGVLIGLVIAANIISMLRCQDMISTAKNLSGFKHSLDLISYNKKENKKTKNMKRNQSFSRTGPDSVRMTRKKRVHLGVNRQDPDGVSLSRYDIDEEFESSISNIPLPPPPPPAVRESTLSIDELSLPPPPRPESIIDVPKLALNSFASLPSILREEDLIEVDDLAGEEMAMEKARAFFGNIRESRVTLISAVVTFLLFAPTLFLFAAGIFFPHENDLYGLMGRNLNATNTTVLGKIPHNNTRDVVESSAFVEELPSDLVTVASPKSSEETLEEYLAIGERRNLVTTLSATFMLFYTLAGIAPFVVFCVSSKTFRVEVKRFVTFCLCCKWNNYNKQQIVEDDGTWDRSRSNRNLALVTQNATNYNSRSSPSNYEMTRSRTLTRDATPGYGAVPKQSGRPLRREKTISNPRYVSWERKERR